MFLTELDISIFHIINGACGQSKALDRLFVELDQFLIKGLVLTGTFGVLWFQSGEGQYRRREILTSTLIAVTPALVVNRVISTLLPFRVRPMWAPDIGYRPLLIDFSSSLEHWSGFPSDTATLLGLLTTGFWLASRFWGLVFGSFSVVVLLSRICIGVHYPGDVLVGALIGMITALTLNQNVIRTSVTLPILAIEKRSPALFYGLLLPVLFEIGILFSNVRRIGIGLFHVLVR